MALKNRIADYVRVHQRFQNSCFSVSDDDLEPPVKNRREIEPSIIVNPESKGSIIYVRKDFAEKLPEPEAAPMISLDIEGMEDLNDYESAGEDQSTDLTAEVSPGKERTIQQPPQMLQKRAPQRLPRDIEFQFELQEKAEGRFQGKKRGRGISDEDLENHLLAMIKHTVLETKAQVTRIWIMNAAKEYVNHHQKPIKCSKGWLDKFLRRNEKKIRSLNHLCIA